MSGNELEVSGLEAMGLKGVKPQDYSQLLAQLTPEIVARLRTATELGKWENGDSLTADQREHCLQAVIAWEYKYLPETARTGYIDKGSKGRGNKR
jgi:uncharacterized protein